jgi:hypothetical protein
MDTAIKTDTAVRLREVVAQTIQFSVIAGEAAIRQPPPKAALAAGRLAEIIAHTAHTMQAVLVATTTAQAVEV